MSSTVTEILLLSTIALVSCSSEKRVEVEYVCEQGHTHREAVEASDSSYRVGSQVDCLPGGK